MIIPQKPRTMDTMSDAELNTKLQHSYEQSLAGEGVPFNEVFDELDLMCEPNEGRRSGEEEGYVSSDDVRAYFHGKGQ